MRKNYDKLALLKALENIRKGAAIRDTSRKYGIPFTTLRNKFVGVVPIDKKPGPKTYLSKEEEDELVKWIIKMGTIGFPVTKDQLLDSVQKIINETPRPNPFKNNRPGIHWFNAFKKRYYNVLKEKTPEILFKRRAQISETEIRAWFSKVQEYLASQNLLNIDPSRIFNCDEAAFFLSPKGSRVIVSAKQKSAYNLSTVDEKECLTSLVIGNAAGQLPPPLIMYKYKRIPNEIARKAPKHFLLGKSDSGWMTAEVFYAYVANTLVKWCKEKGITFPIILYVDGHASHLTRALSRYCAANEIILVRLHPNATHLLQPMYVYNKWRGPVEYTELFNLCYKCTDKNINNRGPANLVNEY